MKRILVTGAAGFIGYYLSKRLINEQYEVVGLDNINDYYSRDLKFGRLQQLGIDRTTIERQLSPTKALNSKEMDGFTFIKADLSDRDSLESIFERNTFDAVVNLAAQAGVRYSLENPHAYTASNVEGFLNILEGCRNHDVRHLIYASSSSVYGANAEVPFNITDRADQPVSLYAATKRANELMAYTYAHLYDIPSTGLRFFTVYGPWGRPDMAYYKFANLMREGKSIDVYNNGKMSRDFTFIDDIVESIVRLILKAPEKKNGAPTQLFNIGNGSPVSLLEFIEILEDRLGIKAEKNMMPMQPGDVERTWANVDDLYEYIGYKPKIDIHEGINKFVQWYRTYHELP